MDIMQDLKLALDYIDGVADNGNAQATLWANRIVNDKPRSTNKIALKRWFVDSGADLLDTIQITVRDGKVVKVWAPGVRELDISKSSYFTLDGSRRDYVDCVAVACAKDTAIYYNADMQTFIVYSASL